MQALPAYARTALELNGLDDQPHADPARRPAPARGAAGRSALSTDLAGPLGASRQQIRDAWRDALRPSTSSRQRCFAEGRKALAEAQAKGEKLLVLVGRPYNIYDTGINLGLPQKIAEQGRTVLPMDFLEPDLALLRRALPQHLLELRPAASSPRSSRSPASDDLDAVYLTNFNCGPDSFLLSYAEEIMGNRPFLTLELDEHGADAGYMTRIEAFFDVLRRAARPRRSAAGRPHAEPPTICTTAPSGCRPCIPLARVPRGRGLPRHGYDARALPPEDRAVLRAGPVAHPRLRVPARPR